MKVIIAGGRDFNNYPLLKEKCDSILSNIDGSIEVVCGCADGADLLGKRYAEERGYSVNYFPANWNLYKRGAGPVRNREMAEYGDALILFWDGKSRGSANMLKEAEAKGLKTRIIKY